MMRKNDFSRCLQRGLPPPLPSPPLPLPFFSERCLSPLQCIQYLSIILLGLPKTITSLKGNRPKHLYFNLTRKQGKSVRVKDFSELAVLLKTSR